MEKLPAQMSHITVTAPGGAEKLQIAQSPLPQPGAGQVLIRVAAAGVNRADILQRQGKYPSPEGASPVMGLEVSGEIVALGDNVSEWRIGDTVCALLSGGGYAEYAVAEAVLCLPLPDGVSIVDAAGLPEVAFTAYSNLIMAAQLRSNENILIHAGASGVGTFAIQFAHALGAHVFTTVGGQEKQLFCQDLGAQLAVNYRHEDFLTRLQKETDGKNMNVILDVLGGAMTEKNIDLLAPGGRLVVIACPEGAKANINLVKLMQKRLQLHGTVLRSRPLREKAEIAARLRAEVWPLFAEGKIRPVTYQTLKLSEAAVAHRVLESRQHIGKLVLTVT